VFFPDSLAEFVAPVFWLASLKFGFEPAYIYCMRPRRSHPEFWEHLNFKNHNNTSTHLSSLVHNFVSLSIPKGSTNRDVVRQVAAAAHIPVDRLCRELNDPVFLRGQVIQGFAGDEFDQIADHYDNMQWWLSDTGLRMAIMEPPERVEDDPEFESIAVRAARRSAVVMARLAKKRWTRRMLAEHACVGPNSIYQYLDGTRRRIKDATRRAIARALGISEDQLPE
jgi:hypothetical protein